jgi:hypothetical protein
MITVVTTDGKQYVYKTTSTEENDMVTNAILTNQGFMLEGPERKIAYAPAGISRVVIED